MTRLTDVCSAIFVLVCDILAVAKKNMFLLKSMRTAPNIPLWSILVLFHSCTLCVCVCVSCGSVGIVVLSCEQSLLVLTQFHFSNTEALDGGGGEGGLVGER